MKSFLRPGGLIAAAILLAACASHSTGVLPTGGTGPMTPAGVDRLSDGVTQIAYRRACDDLHQPGMMYCDLLVPVDGMQPNIIGYGPSDLQSAYNLPSSDHGNGVLIAIVDAYGYPNAESDLAGYRTGFGLSDCTTQNGCFQKLNQKGQAGPYPPTNSGWDGEQALDVDMVSASCPNCKIMLIEANNNSGKSLGIAARKAASLGAHVVSNSYSGNCSGFTGKECGIAFYNHVHTVFLASAGDGRYWGAGQQYVPAGLPTVVAVGGTMLTKDSSNPRGWDEAVWNQSGSGCTMYKKPPWQKDTGCTGRTANDVSAIATGVATYFNGRFGTAAGTSVSSPLLAGVYGLANDAQMLHYAKKLYTHASKLYDVVNGNNGTCSPSYICTAGPGYDGPTGNGTPNGIGAF